MSDEKKRNFSSKSAKSTNTMSKSLLSLKDIALGIADSETQLKKESLSKSGENINDKPILDEKDNIVKDSSEIRVLLDKVAELANEEKSASSTVTVRISKKSHRILAELKLDDDFANYRYGDILEGLLYTFIQRNRTEIKKKLSQRKNSI